MSRALRKMSDADKTATAVCKRCDTPGLKWRQNPRSGKWCLLVEPFVMKGSRIDFMRSIHRCDGKRVFH